MGRRRGLEDDGAGATHWSENPDNPSHLQSPLQWALCNTERPVVDTFIALTLHNLLGRHPDVRILSIENGSSWLKPLFKTVDKAAALKRWIIVGFAAGAALFGYSPVLVAAAGIIEEGEADWIADVQRYVDSHAAGTAGPRDAVA